MNYHKYEQAEHALEGAVELVLEAPHLNLMEQPDFERRQTIGDFLKRLKRRVKVDRELKDRLYTFLNMRNKFVHNLSEVPGWDLDTTEGREIAKKFLIELAFTSFGIAALFTTLVHVSAKDDYGEELIEEEEELERKLFQIFEKQFGGLARKVLAGRYRKPHFVHGNRRH